MAAFGGRDEGGISIPIRPSADLTSSWPVSIPPDPVSLVSFHFLFFSFISSLVSSP